MADNLKQKQAAKREKNNAKRRARYAAKKAAKDAVSSSQTTTQEKPRGIGNMVSGVEAFKDVHGIGSKPTTNVGNGGRVTTSKDATVPGLTTFEPNQVSGMLPQWNSDSYSITDPLAPSDSLPQVSEADFERGATIYQGTQRALKLTGMAIDVTKERFTVEKKRAGAFGAGIQAATAFEKVRGDHYDYLTQLESNGQKSVTLDVAGYRTDTLTKKAEFERLDLDSQLSQAKTKADLSQAKAQSSRKALDEFLANAGLSV
jgi:hypothetical protein